MLFRSNYQIFRWVKLAQKQGLEALRVKHTKKEYSFEFKLDAVRYYLIIKDKQR